MELPKIYKNKINIDESRSYKLNNNKKEINILNELPVKAYIKTKEKEITEVIVGKTKNFIITKNQDVIEIKDLIELKKA